MFWRTLFWAQLQDLLLEQAVTSSIKIKKIKFIFIYRDIDR